MSSADFIRSVWPEWKPVRLIGSGSFGEVYECSKNSYGADLRSAIKVIRVPKDESHLRSLASEGVSPDNYSEYLNRITDDCVNEIRLMTSLKSEANIVHVEDYCVVPNKNGPGSTILIRMEMLWDSFSYLARNKFNERLVLKLAIDICSALEVCEKRGIVHRDIKPSNIMVSDGGIFKLGDFGIARKLSASQYSYSSKGTLLYVAPEVYNPTRRYDHRVDIYSLGLMLYQYMNGNCLPFVRPGSDPAERDTAVLRRLRNESFPPPYYASYAFRTIIMKACAYDPAGRFASAHEMKRALKQALGALNMTPAPEIRPERNVRSAQKAVPAAAKPVYTAGNDPYGSGRSGGDPDKSRRNRLLVLSLCIAAGIIVFALTAFVVIGGIIEKSARNGPTGSTYNYQTVNSYVSETTTAASSAVIRTTEPEESDAVSEVSYADLDEEPPQGELYYIGDSAPEEGAKLLSSLNDSSFVITLLPRGCEVYYTGTKSGAYAYIYIINGNETVYGWIKSKYLVEQYVEENDLGTPARISDDTPGGAGVNLRRNPTSSDSDFICVLPEGTEVFSLGIEDGNYTKVRLPDGTIGWVFTRYLTYD